MKGIGRFRPTVAGLGVATSLLTGCSLLYNPDSLSPHPDMPADATDAPPPPDVLDPNALMLTVAGPPDLYEGQGTGGSPQAFLVLVGSNISKQAEITLVATAAGETVPQYTLDLAHLAHAADNSAIAVPITLPVDPAAANTDVKVTVHVKQAGKLGDIDADLAGQITLHSLLELDDAHAAVPASTSPLRYSQVVLTQPLVVSPVLNGQPTIIHSMSNIELGDVTASGNLQTPGRGGGAGGATGAAGTGPAAGTGGALLVAGTGGGFGTGGAGATNVAGDPLITSYASNKSSGGGGGGGAAGGGGGGTIELHAEGLLKVGKVTANGGLGGAAAPALTAGGGGGGSGGAIVLRAGMTATLGALSVAGGAGGAGSGLLAQTGTAGGTGRIRIDAPALAGTMPAFSDLVRRGVAFDPATPLITRDKRVTLTLNSAKASESYIVTVFKTKDVSLQSGAVLFTTSSQAVPLDLFDGYNKICVALASLPPAFDDPGADCVELAYVRFEEASGAVTRGRLVSAAPASPARRLR
ncbi:MAG TPA: hypothetical protein VGC42_20845 [Kofleriaceae bacterium]